MELRRVFVAGNHPEAGAMQALLSEHGIESELRGGNLDVLGAQLPNAEGRPSLWVRDERQKYVRKRD